MLPFESPHGQDSEDWGEAIAFLCALPHHSVCLIVGGEEHAQNSFVMDASRALSELGIRAAIVDANIENSKVGCPGTVTVAWAAPNIERLNELPALAEYFIGSFSAHPVALELTSAVARAVKFAVANGASRIMVELPPLDSSAASRRLMAALAQTVAPDMIAAASDYPSIEDVVQIASALHPSVTIKRIGARADGASASRTHQTLLTRTRLFRALSAGMELRVPLDDRGPQAVYTLNTRLGIEQGLQPHLLRWISETLRLHVARAELTPRRSLDLYVASGGAAERNGSAVDQSIVAEHFNVATVREISLSRIVGAYVGLVDENGKLVGIGRVAGMREATQELVVTSSAGASHRVRIVQFGKARIAADGNVLDDG